MLHRRAVVYHDITHDSFSFTADLSVVQYGHNIANNGVYSAAATFDVVTFCVKVVNSSFDAFHSFLVPS